MVEIKPFGAWPSPITAESLSSGSVAYDTCVDNDSIYWCSTVATEQGRGQIFKQKINESNTPPQALLPEGYDCLTRVHEYGRGSFKVSNDLIVFSNNKDCRIYTIINDEIKPLTPAGTLFRYADFVIDTQNRFLVCIREEHFVNEEPKDVVNVVVSIDLNSGKETVIAQGKDFYSSPRLSPSDKELAYVCWNHPNMPWDFTELYHAKIEFENEQLNLNNLVCVAGDDIDESISVSSNF